LCSSAEALSSAEKAPAVIVTQNAWKDSAQTSLAKALLDAAPNAVVVAIRDPFDASALPSAGTFLCTYSPKPEAMEAAAAVLLGIEKPAGSLPL
jgi:hypothetical protein